MQDISIDDADELASIGERIRAARRSRGISQSELAQRVGVSQPAIANWETGVHDPRHVILGKLAETLHISRAWLADGAKGRFDHGRDSASVYLRRPLVHVPIISLEDAARVGADPAFDPRDTARDYIPVTSNSPRLFAIFAEDDAVNLAFPRDTIVVIDYGERTPTPENFFLAAPNGPPILRLWKSGPDRLEPFSSDPTHQTQYIDDPACLIGRARVSIRIF